jgi:hypothetical protein
MPTFVSFSLDVLRSAIATTAFSVMIEVVGAVESLVGNCGFPELVVLP